MAQSKLQLGDSVVVKPNVEELDLNINIGGWQGRVAEIEEEDSLISPFAHLRYSIFNSQAHNKQVGPN